MNALEDLHGCLRAPERPYPSFPGGCPAPLNLSLPGIVFGELCGACPVQGEGVAKGREFTFYARYGTWNMEIEGARRAHYRNFSGDDPRGGWMPPSVAFALITSKLLWHVCVGKALRPWPGPGGLSDEHLVDLHTWLCFHDDWRTSDLRHMHNAVLVEAERRRWPDGWWEDPSVVLEAR